jgi:hypothetical protein
MPRGKHYPEEMREEARRLRREGWSLGEIAKKLGPPKNTLTLWVRDIALTTQQQQRIKDHEREILSESQRLGGAYHRKARLQRIATEHEKAEVFLDTLEDINRTNHISAAMLYLGEGAKTEGSFLFANSNPQIIIYWIYLMRTSFDIDEVKFRIQVLCRYDQDLEDLERFWIQQTGIRNIIQGRKDTRTEGKPTLRPDYKGVCKVYYYDVAIRRYLDALAHGLMERAVGKAKG